MTPKCRCKIHIANEKQEDKNRTEGNHYCTLIRILLRSVSRWSVRTCIAERASWVRQQLYRHRITDDSFWKWQAHKDVYYMVFISFKNSECTKILKSRCRSSSVEHWRRQHGHKKVKTPWYFLCATLFGMDENHASCLLACVFPYKGLVVVHDSSEWHVVCRWFLRKSWNFSHMSGRTCKALLILELSLVPSYEDLVEYNQ